MFLLLSNIILVIVEALILPNNKGGRKVFLFLAFTQLFILHAFLDPFVMEDLEGYYLTYETFAKESLYNSIFVGYVGVKMEPGWIVLCKLLGFISSNPRFLLIVTSIVIVGSYLNTAYRYSPLIGLSVLIFLCTTFDQSMFVLRQHTAMAICLMSIPYILKRDFKRFFIIWLLAFGCHMTAIVFLPMFFIYPINIERKYWFYMVLGTIIGVLLISVVFNWVFHNLWYDSYEDTTAENKGGSNLTGFFMILSSMLLYLVSINWNLKKAQGAEKFFFLMLSVGAILSLSGVGFSPTNRLIKYFMIASVYLIPISIQKFKSQAVRYLIIIAVAGLYILLFLSPSNINYISNYHLIF